MGNTIYDDSKYDPAESYNRWLQQNPDLIDQQILFDNKFFRTCSFNYKERRIILKVFFNKNLQSVKQYLKGFQMLQKYVDESNSCHIIPLRIIDIKETIKGTINFIGGSRQYIQSTLQERLQSRPKLSIQNKQWIIFQMILSLQTLHDQFNMYHGSIRTSNFLFTSYHYLLMTDIACAKPTYIIQDTENGLREFRLFYGSSINKCSLAPQKFINNKQAALVMLNPFRNLRQQLTTQESAKTNSPKKTQTSQMSAQVQIEKLKKMDIFSLGCAIIQILSNGKSVLTYENLLKFKRKQIELDSVIDKLTENLRQGPNIAIFTKKLLSLDPEQRPNIRQIYEQWSKIIDEEFFLLLWHCISAFSLASFCLADTRICLFYEIYKFIEIEIRKNPNGFKIQKPYCLENFQSLRIFVQALKSKIIPTLHIRNQCLLAKLICYVDNKDSTTQFVQSEDEDSKKPMNRQEFFLKQTTMKIKKQASSNVTSPITFQKKLCPPQWSEQLLSLVQPKYKGIRLTLAQQLQNRFQDNLQKIKKNQHYRKQRIQNNKNYYARHYLALKIIFSCLRNCKYCHAKLAGIEILNLIARQTEDQLKLIRVLPYLINLSYDTDISVSRLCIHSMIDLFYYFIDPFQTEAETNYYVLFITTMIDYIKNGRFRLIIFSRLQELYQICQWLQTHCKKLSKNYKKMTFNDLIQAIKQFFGMLSSSQIQILLENIPIPYLVDFYTFTTLYTTVDKLSVLKLALRIAQHCDVQINKKQLTELDQHVQDSLSQSGISLCFAIRYFTMRKITNKTITKKIAPLIIHPHLWVRQYSLDYINMCLKQFPATRIFFMFRQVFQPPFPLQPEDSNNSILLPLRLNRNEVDFHAKKFIDNNKINRKVGLTENLFLKYLERASITNGYINTKYQEIADWQNKSRSFKDNVLKDVLFITFSKAQSAYSLQSAYSGSNKEVSPNINMKQPNSKIDASDFRKQVRDAITQLYENNFLYYTGMGVSKYQALPYTGIKEKEKQLLAFEEYCKKYCKFSLEEPTVGNDKREFFDNLASIINRNFEKLLKKFNKEYSNDKIKVAQSIYLIFDILNKFEQFQVRPTLKLGEIIRAPIQVDKLAKPKGVLVSQIFEHKDIVSSIERIGDSHFATGSHDGTVRVFNTKKIEMNVIAQSEGVYEIKTENHELCKVTSMALFQNTYSLAVGTNKGLIKICQTQRLGINRQKTYKSEPVQISSYNVNSEVEKVITFKNQLSNQCFCYVTSQGQLGIQDLRVKNQSLSCSIGKQRGLPKCLILSHQPNTVLIGTISGYLLKYDTRCNIISSVLRLYNNKQPIPILNIQQTINKQYESKPLYIVSYPSDFYQFSYFDLTSEKDIFHVEKQFISASSNQTFTCPYFVNRTQDEKFMLCSNTLTSRTYYKGLSDFHKNFSILDYLSDPITNQQTGARQVWIDQCRYRYNQINSIYTKKSVSFIEQLSSGLLVNMNPASNSLSNKNAKKVPLTLLTEKDRRESGSHSNVSTDIDRYIQQKPNTYKTFVFPEQQSSQLLTCMKVVPRFVVAATRNYAVKIYK